MNPSSDIKPAPQSVSSSPDESVAAAAHGRMDLELKARLVSRIEKHIAHEPNSGCWIWTGAVDGWGYGKVKVAHNYIGAHRVAWLAHIGPIPAGASLLHRCDVACCVNPHHLFLGTQQDNVDDMMSKQRGRYGVRRGEQCSHAKLTASQVLAIRASVEPLKLVSARYGIAQSTVSDIRLGKRWRHI